MNYSLDDLSNLSESVSVVFAINIARIEAEWKKGGNLLVPTVSSQSNFFWESLVYAQSLLYNTETIKGSAISWQEQIHFCYLHVENVILLCRCRDDKYVQVFPDKEFAGDEEISRHLEWSRHNDLSGGSMRVPLDMIIWVHNAIFYGVHFMTTTNSMVCLMLFAQY
jgi:hypothetical protein